MYNATQLAREGDRVQAAILSRNKPTYLAGSKQKAQLRVQSVKPKNIPRILAEPPQPSRGSPDEKLERCMEAGQRGRMPNSWPLTLNGSDLNMFLHFWGFISQGFTLP